MTPDERNAELIEDVDDEVPECDNCGYQTEVRSYLGSEGEKIKLCRICANTHLSKAITSYMCKDPALYTSIAYIANLLLDEIRKVNRDPA